MNIERIDKFTTRNIHNLTSELIYFETVIPEFTFGDFSLDELQNHLINIRRAAEVIKNHRSRDSKLGDVDVVKFMRCCDILEPASTILQRSYDWMCTYRSDITIEATFSECVRHIKNKYLGKNGVLMELPFDWANKEYSQCRKDLTYIIDRIEDSSILMYGKFINPTKAHTKVLVDNNILDLDRLL